MRTKTSKHCHNHRLLAVAMALATLAPIAASSQEDSFYAFNLQLEAYPQGKGQVYGSADPETMWLGLAQEAVPQWYDKMSIKFVSDYKNILGVAKPADGYLYAGFRTAKLVKDGSGKLTVERDSKGNVVYGDHKAPDTWVWGIDSDVTLYDGSGNVVNSKTRDDSLAVLALMPAEPNNYVQMLFSRVVVRVKEGQSGLGTASFEERSVVNDLGQGVYARAEPTGTSEFEGWYRNGQLIDTNPYISFYVKDTYVLEARFTNPLARTLTFPQGGGYLEWYSDYEYELPENMYAYSPDLNGATMVETGIPTLRHTRAKMEKITGSLPGRKPLLIYGEGEVTIFPLSEKPAANPANELLFHWSGEQGYETMFVDEFYTYYVFNEEKNCFEHFSGATIEPGKVFMEVYNEESPFDATLGLPERVYLNMLGDVNEDENVDVGDIMAIINVMASQSSGTKPVWTANVNEDGNVDVGDIMAVINIMARK